MALVPLYAVDLALYVGSTQPHRVHIVGGIPALSPGVYLGQFASTIRARTGQSVCHSMMKTEHKERL